MHDIENLNPPRARRRAQTLRKKAHVLRIVRRWSGNRESSYTPRQLGVLLSTHCRPCNCYACVNDYDWWSAPPPRERAFHDPENPEDPEPQ